MSKRKHTNDKNISSKHLTNVYRITQGWMTTNLTHMVDEGGANMNAIEEVFWKEFMAHKRVVTCQWHFKSCARRQLPVLTRMNKF